MFDWIAPLIGRKVVWLLDHDGEVTKRWAHKTPFGFVCYRHAFGPKCLLVPGGEVRGPLYVVRWME